jgi:purine-nucleoside phosphorylase
VLALLGVVQPYPPYHPRGLWGDSDLFYDPDPGRAQAWVRAGALAVEMEAATLLAIAARRGVAAAAVLAVSDLVAAGTRIEQDALERAEAELGRAGLAALAAPAA